MRKIKTLALASIAIIALASCKKDNPKPKPCHCDEACMAKAMHEALKKKLIMEGRK